MPTLHFAIIDAYDGLHAELDAICAQLNLPTARTALAELPTLAKPGDVILLQPTSGYHHDLPAYLHTLEQLEEKGCHLLNPLPLIRWNADKHYLQNLAQEGHATLPTLWLEPGTQANLAQLLIQQNWEKAVIKPAISAGAFETRLLNQNQAAEAQPWLEEQLQTRAMLVQPYAPEIASNDPMGGEWSFLFFNGKYSHTIRKLPKSGDFRVQHVHGGHYVAEEAPATILAQAESALKSLPAPALYARVDGIIRNQQLILMEIEAIEPFLYLLPDQNAVQRFAHALQQSFNQITRQQEAA